MNAFLFGFLSDFCQSRGTSLTFLQPTDLSISHSTTSSSRAQTHHGVDSTNSFFAFVCTFSLATFPIDYFLPSALLPPQSCKNVAVSRAKIGHDHDAVCERVPSSNLFTLSYHNHICLTSSSRVVASSVRACAYSFLPHISFFVEVRCLLANEKHENLTTSRAHETEEKNMTKTRNSALPSCFLFVPIAAPSLPPRHHRRPSRREGR